MRNREYIENDLVKAYNKFNNLKKLRERAEDWEIPYIDGDLYKLEDEIEAINEELERFNSYIEDYYIDEERQIQEEYDNDYYMQMLKYEEEEERRLQEEYEAEEDDYDFIMEQLNSIYEDDD